MSKVLNQYTSNNFFQIARSSRKKSIFLVLVTSTAILGWFLVSWLFNSHSLPLDTGRTSICIKSQAINSFFGLFISHGVCLFIILFNKISNFLITATRAT